MSDFYKLKAHKYRSKYLQLKNIMGGSLTQQQRFDLHQVGVDQIIIDELDKEGVDYSNDYIQGLIKGTLHSKNAYDKKTRWIRLNVTGGSPGSANEQGPIFLDLDELKITRKDQLIGYCNSIQFAPTRQGKRNSLGEFDYTYTSTGKKLDSLLYLGQNILTNDTLNDLTTIPITLKTDATIFEARISNI
jgi:hypothetical protein